MTAAALTEMERQQPVRAAEQLQADILARIRQVAKDSHIGFDKNGESDFGLLASSDPLVKPFEAEILRYALAAGIRRGMQRQPPGLSVPAARILGMLNQYLWVAQHPFQPEIWPPRESIGEV